MKTKERKQENPISRDLEENIKQVKNVFQDCSNVIYRELQLTEDIRGLLVYIEGIAKVEDVQQHILRPRFLRCNIPNGQIPLQRSCWSASTCCSWLSGIRRP